MHRSLLTSWVRLAVIALLGVLASSCPRSAYASGCHVDERPRFGLSSIGEPSPVKVRIEDNRISPQPCSGDSSASDAGPSAIPAILPDLAHERPAPPITSPLPRPSGDLAVSFPCWADRSRPPRA